MQENDTQSGGSSVQIGRDNTINHGIGYREISRLIRSIEIVILAACICGSATIGAVIYGHRYMPHPGDAITVTSFNMIDDILHDERQSDNSCCQKKSLSC
jgi:hypothetical protein